MKRTSHNPSESSNAAHTIPREAIEVQLGRILEGPLFAGSVRLKSLLAFVVTQYLQGNVASLKEIVIGTEVFGKPAGYDPKSDSIVRTTAQRLRAELATYYETEGAGDPILSS